MSQTTLSAPRVRESMDRLKGNIAKIIRGKDSLIEDVLTGLLASGHILIEDLPGLGKTSLAYCLARSLDCDFTRIQFTSDLLPSDVIGVSIYDERERGFIFQKGPIFSNIVLADEINRATPKTQSALLEAMDRGKVSQDGETYPMGEPFMVFATQNPVDYESTFPLPESQMDRFLMRLHMGYPGFEDELEILRNGFLRYDQFDVGPVLKAAELAALQARVPAVFLEDSVVRYLLKIIGATRTETEFRAGASTRASLALKTAAQASALMRGRDFVIPEDVVRMVQPVLGHRLVLRRPPGDAMEERHTIQSILTRLVDRIPLPV
ncbi:MAG: MoxR family ATPase [Opitutales bacterium]|nr:MoxR family ATPase [Opitutales bacterium]